MHDPIGLDAGGHHWQRRGTRRGARAIAEAFNIADPEQQKRLAARQVALKLEAFQENCGARMITWFKSWFSTSGTLDAEAYVKHVIAAHAFFFAFGLLGMALFWLMLGPMIALRAPAWLAWLPILMAFPLLVLAVGSWAGILITSTMRFVRHLMKG